MKLITLEVNDTYQREDPEERQTDSKSQIKSWNTENKTKLHNPLCWMLLAPDGTQW